MRKRLFAALLCVMLVMTLLPVTTFAADGPKTYTFTSTQIFAATDLRANVYFKGDTIVFTPDAIEPFTSSDHGVCKTPNVGLKIGGGTDVTGGICSVNTYSSDGGGYMVSFTITSDNPVTLDYKGAGPTGIETPHPDPGDNWYAYRYLELQFVAHPTNYAVDYDLGTYGSWQIGTNQPTSFVLDGNKGTYSLQIPTPQSNNSNYYFSGWLVSENARILGISNLAESGYAQTAYPVNGETVIPLFIGFKGTGTGARTGTEGFTLEAIWSSMPRAAAPTFSIDGGNYTSTQMVSLSCTTPNATIYYTTDGSVPSYVTSTEYTTPIEVSSTTKITAKAFPPASVSMNASEVVSETYTIGTPPVETVATPTFNPIGGTYTSAKSVTISCTTPGATIRYTDDGSEPTESSTLYNGAISVSSTTTLKAKAFKSGMTASETASATYTISVAPPPTVSTVAVNPASVSIQKGGTQTFNATVFGTNSPAQTVTWSVEGGIAATSIDANGVLSIAANETAATLTVKATSTVNTAKFGVATVTVTEPVPTDYVITKGANGRWTKGGTGGLGFTADSDYAKFTAVSMDGTVLSSNDYSSQSGSTIITLKPAYLQTLSAGNHTLRIHFIDGYAETSFTIVARELDPVPQTGDSSNTILWITLLLIGGAGLTAASIYSRKNKHSAAK